MHPVISQPDHDAFSWTRVRELLGLPYHDPRVQDLFARAGVNPDSLLRDVRVGIYSMPPHDQQPCPVTEIDLTAMFRVRMRFRHARLVKGASATAAPTDFVFSGITYFLEYDPPLEPFRGSLPWGIGPTENVNEIVERVGRPPNTLHETPGDEFGFVLWDDKNPVLHVLFLNHDKRVVRINAFLPANGSEI